VASFTDAVSRKERHHAIGGTSPTFLPLHDMALGLREREPLATVFQLVKRIHNNRRPLNMIKDAAYAWRQMLFFMSLAGPSDQSAIVNEGRDELTKQTRHVVVRLAPAIDGLAHVVNGGRFDADGGADSGRRFLGWAVEGHWMHPSKVERVAG
jgi:hypothetical protein